MFYRDRKRFFAQRAMVRDAIDLHIVARPDGPGGQRLIATAIQFEPVSADQPVAQDYVPPTLSLSADEAQQLVDELWLCGVRPSEGTGSAGALAATQKHLDDMRTLATKLLEKVLA